MSTKAIKHLQQLLATRIEAAAVHCPKDEKQREKERDKPPVY